MRILYLADCVIPSRTANSVHVMRMCHAFAKLQHDVTLLIPAVPDRRTERGEPGVADVYEFYDVKPIFRIRRFPNKHLHRYATAAAMGVQAGFARVDRVYGRQIIASMVSAALFQDTTLELHEPLDATVARSRATRWLSRLPGLRGVVTISDSLRQHVEARDPGFRGRVLTAHDAADPMPDTPPVSLGSPAAFQVGYVGHLYAGKAMEMIERLAPLCPWAHFHVVGGRSREIEYWSGRISELRNITLHGFQPQPALPAYLAAFDAVVAPFQKSVTGSSGRVDTSPWMSPLKLFEYMAAGKAIICSDLPVLREVLTDGQTALLCDPDDAAEWARTLTRMKADDDLRHRLGANARNEFTQRYTWLKRAERLSRVLEGPHFAE